VGVGVEEEGRRGRGFDCSRGGRTDNQRRIGG